jgi:cytosine/adenosine deaminase-related metal-dependent hydrolase
MLEDFRRYRQAGVTMTLGTDTSPQNMWEEMRHAAIMARAAGRDSTACTAADVFNAATLGGAKALRRDDIGRIAVGARADLVLVDLGHPALAPGNDPIRTMVFNAAERPVKDVYVGGDQVVANGRVLTIAEAAMAQAMTAAQRRALEAYPGFDRAGRAAEEVAPPVFPMAAEAAS